MGANQSAKGMAGEDGEFAKLAVGLNEDAKAERAKRGDDVEETGVSPVTAALEEMAKAYSFNSATLSGDVATALLDQYKHRPKPFAQMTEGEQSDLVAACNEVGKTIVGKMVLALAAEERPHVRGKVKSLTDDGNKVKLTLLIDDADPDELRNIHEVMSKQVLVILAEPDDHISHGGAELIEPNESAFEFEPGADDDKTLAD